MEGALLALDKVTTYYAQMRILEGISLKVGAGELVCLLGGNASGKSTTLKTILGHRAPARRPRAARRRGRDRAGRSRSESPTVWRSSPRTAACSGR